MLKDLFQAKLRQEEMTKQDMQRKEYVTLTPNGEQPIHVPTIREGNFGDFRVYKFFIGPSLFWVQFGH